MEEPYAHNARYYVMLCIIVAICLHEVLMHTVLATMSCCASSMYFSLYVYQQERTSVYIYTKRKAGG